MGYTELKWTIGETGGKIITAEGISANIEINEDKKEIKNVKTFFREIIYMSFLNNMNKKIILVEDKDNEVPEVKTIINELIQLCNSELEAKIPKQDCSL